jgi:hypothetical protein
MRLDIFLLFKLAATFLLFLIRRYTELHAQGFMALKNWKFAGNVSDPEARLIVTILSSIGWRSTSSTRIPNSGNSSRNKTPRWPQPSPGIQRLPQGTS